jgi:group I intron endonuclease
MGFIYMLTSPSGKSYIGQTIQTIKKRFGAHQLLSSQCVAILGAIQKYGWENFENHWYEVPDEDLDKHEELMVEVLGTLAPGGYNLREGGGSHGKHSEISNQKNREAHLGKTRSEESKQKQSVSIKGENNPFYGKSHTEENKQILREQKLGNQYKLGKTHTEESRKKQRDSQLGKTRTEESKQKQSVSIQGEKNHKSKRVYQYNLLGKLVETFGSSREAARHLGKTNGSKIRACACGDRLTAYGFKWSHTEL